MPRIELDDILGSRKPNPKEKAEITYFVKFYNETEENPQNKSKLNEIKAKLEQIKNVGDRSIEGLLRALHGDVADFAKKPSLSGKASAGVREASWRASDRASAAGSAARAATSAAIGGVQRRASAAFQKEEKSSAHHLVPGAVVDKKTLHTRYSGNLLPAGAGAKPTSNTVQQSHGGSAPSPKARLQQGEQGYVKEKLMELKHMGHHPSNKSDDTTSTASSDPKRHGGKFKPVNPNSSPKPGKKG